MISLKFSRPTKILVGRMPSQSYRLKLKIQIKGMM